MRFNPFREKSVSSLLPSVLVATAVVAAFASVQVTVADENSADSDVTQPDSRPSDRKQVNELSAARLVRLDFPMTFDRGFDGHEYAMAFTQMYKAEKDAPKIFGAYMDVRKKCMVVVGPPECEVYVHGVLAKWDCEVGGIEEETLDDMRQGIASDYRRAIQAITVIELAKVDVSPAKAKELDAKIAEFQTELDALRRKLEIIKKRQKQLADFEREVQQD